MRALCLAILSLAVATPAFATDCTDQVLAAFAKQRASKAFRVEFSQPSAEGDVHMTIDYMPPDRMLQTVTSPAMPGEQQTMLVGNRAFAGTSGTLEELLPQFTQSILAEANQAMFAPPKGLSNFECLGQAKLDGQEFTAYRTIGKTPETDPSKTLARTIYVDPATGLPAFNVVARPADGDKSLLKVKYSYPTDIDIVAPTNAPVQKLQ
ncbi:hypothetical protein [Hyphomicrobium sp.]|uniref:hypothetical protein n=1 Tax=Hyphomicrobium sp. TaxID=82 RepID=UPI002D783D32|nr:hypothetical protein [Hyphomicrobium sp.]HET6388202.1 hypothetical protein [Hyphomicrobium sp.]